MTQIIKSVEYQVSGAEYYLEKIRYGIYFGYNKTREFKDKAKHKLKTCHSENNVLCLA